tara:strand:- start:303 stop:653 length:351 start_codon:yes stop_codon:yes gene_type:complete
MSKNVKIEGIVKEIGDIQKFGVNDFRKRVLIVEVEDSKDAKYNQMIPVEWIKDAGDKLNDLSVGQSVIVTGDLQGREGSGRYWLSFKGWKIEAGAAPVKNDFEPGEDIDDLDKMLF